MIEITPHIYIIVLLSFPAPIQKYYTLVGRFCLGGILRWVQHASKGLLEANCQGQEIPVVLITHISTFQLKNYWAFTVYQVFCQPWR